MLEDELGMPAEVADRVVEACSAKARVVAEQQLKEKEEAERKRLEDEQLSSSVLGDGSEPPVETDEAAESAAASILGDGPNLGDGLGEPEQLASGA